jgi:AbrB family looped-hinge helix DNA binding protein
MHTTLTSKGQMTLPSAVRSQLGLEAGDQLSVTVLDAETIVLKRRVSRSVGALRGLLPRPAKALTLQEIDAGVAAHLGRKMRVRAPAGKSGK